MNVGIPLTLSSLCLAHILVAQTPIAVLDDAILVSQGVHLPTPPIETFGNRFQTLSGFTLHTWDGATGNLIDAKELPSPISPNQDPSTLESPESNLFAYQNTAGHLVLRDYENGEVLRIHNFNTQYQNRTPRLLRLLTGGKLLLVQTQIKSSSSSSFASYSNEHHLIDTENGDIIRSFPTGSASTFSLLSIPNDEAILIIDYDFTFSSGSIPDQTPLLIQGHRLHGIYLINSQTAEDLIPPIKPDPNAVGFRGSITANPDLSLFFACLSPDTIFRINVSDASVTSTPLAGFTDLQFLTFKNQSLFGLVKKENDSFFSNRLATWNSQTLQLRSIIDRLIDGYPTIRTYLPSLKDNQAIITTHSGGIEIWDTLSQSKLQTIREENVNGFGEAVNNLSLSPDGKKLIAHVSTQPQPESIVLDLESREKLYSTADLLPTGIFSPNSRYTLFRDDQDKLIAIDLNNGRKTFETPSKGRKTIAVGFYNNENILAVSDDGYVKKIDSQNAILRPLDFPNPKIYNINSQDGSLLYAAGNQVRLYTPANDQESTLWDFAESEPPHQATLNADGGRLLLHWPPIQVGIPRFPPSSTPTTLPGKVQLIDPASKALIDAKEDNAIASIAFSPEGSQYLIIYKGSNSLNIHDSTTGELEESISVNSAIHTAAYLPVNGQIIAVSEQALLHIDIADQKISRSSSFAYSASLTNSTPPSLKVSPDGKLALFHSGIGYPRLINAQSLEEVIGFNGQIVSSYDSPIQSVSFDQLSKSLLTVDAVGNVLRWPLRSGIAVPTIINPSHPNGIQAQATVPHNSKLQIYQSADLNSWIPIPTQSFQNQTIDAVVPPLLNHHSIYFRTFAFPSGN